MTSPIPPIETPTFPVLHHPGTGETIRVLESTRDLFRMELTIAPRGEIAGSHLHPNQHQTFEIVSGKLVCRAQGREHVLKPGDTLVLPPGVVHTQGNPFDEPVVAIETYRPGLRIHEFFEAFFSLGARGLTDNKGAPTPLYGAALLDEYKDTIAVGSRVDRVLLRMLAPLARSLGYGDKLRDVLRAARSNPRLELTGGKEWRGAASLVPSTARSARS